MSQLAAPHSLGAKEPQVGDLWPKQTLRSALEPLSACCSSLLSPRGSVTNIGLWVIVACSVGSLVSCKEGKNQSRQRTEVCLFDLCTASSLSAYVFLFL